MISAENATVAAGDRHSPAFKNENLVVKYRNQCCSEEVQIQRKVRNQVEGNPRSTARTRVGGQILCAHAHNSSFLGESTWSWRIKSKCVVLIYNNLPFSGRIGAIRCSYLDVLIYLFLLIRPKKLPTVPETLLKRRKKRDDIRQARVAARRATAKVRMSGVTVASKQSGGN